MLDGILQISLLILTENFGNCVSVSYGSSLVMGVIFYESQRIGEVKLMGFRLVY